MKKIFIPFLIVFVLLSSGCKNNKKAQTPVSDKSFQTDVYKKTNIESLFASNKNLKCEFLESDQTLDTNTKGVMYISNNRIRIDGTTKIKTDATAKEEVVRVSAVIVDGYMYNWGYDETKTGIKLKLEPETSNFDDLLKKEGEYKCSNWITDEKLFGIPTDIKFQDLTEMMSGITK